ncbi:MAG: CRISPR-associated protein Cas4 [Candidatus Cloacimonetes bacterium]|nr:CRISPR-associated protein Cas4 [Candidatus Cloacimonadota bacterium]
MYDRLPISTIKQYAYCKRRFGLMYIDNEFLDNFKTIEGNIFHEKVNDPFFNEKRGEKYYSRSVPVYSDRLGLYGVCDIIEFLKDEKGVSLPTQKGLWKINPIEYKNGKPEKSRADEMQLCAQAMCLEEMFSIDILSGDIYYGKLRKRVNVLLSDELRLSVEKIALDIHQLMEKSFIPQKPEGQNCNLCSMIDICLPRVFKKPSSNLIRISNFLEK